MSLFPTILDHHCLVSSNHAFQTQQRSWYAVFTVPRNEKAVERHLNQREVECFLPTYEAERVWKNRQRVKVILPLFPTYLFVCINRRERSKVLQSPGVLQIVGNSREPLPLPDAEIDLLRSDFCKQRTEPYREFAVGQRVRVRNGIMQGVEGVLVRKNNRLRFILSLNLINQHAAIEVRAEDLEALCA
jgi:transcription elongation factor/antiterminator RfaH